MLERSHDSVRKREQNRQAKRAYRARLANGDASLKGVPIANINALT
jgi:hypothetical protein